MNDEPPPNDIEVHEDGYRYRLRNGRHSEPVDTIEEGTFRASRDKWPMALDFGNLEGPTKT